MLEFYYKWVIIYPSINLCLFTPSSNWSLIEKNNWLGFGIYSYLLDEFN
jgi:hypothetical protein